MRGLKPVFVKQIPICRGRIFYRCVDWNVTIGNRATPIVRRIFYRCVDWNLCWPRNRTTQNRRIFYRCVDWNTGGNKFAYPIVTSHLLQMRGLKPLPPLKSKPPNYVASFTDAWIETIILFEWINYPPVASFTDAWIETNKGYGITEAILSHLLQMRGLKRTRVNT